MTDNSDYANTSGFRLVRLVDGERREPGDIDIDRAIEASSSTAALDDLTRRGHSTVNVLDRDKIATLVRRAVDEAIEQRAEAFLEEEKQRIEAESRLRLGKLLTRYDRPPPSRAAEQQERTAVTPGGGTSDKPPHASGLSSIIAGIIRTELNTQLGTGRIDAVERRVDRLIDGLERAEQAFTGITNEQDRTQQEDAFPQPINEQQQAILDSIFESNIQLQGVAGRPPEEGHPHAEEDKGGI